MSQSPTHADTLVAEVADAVSAGLSALWRRSPTAQEVGRLTRDGRAVGQPCEVAFLLSYAEGGAAEQVTGAARGAGFVVLDVDQQRGFVTVASSVRLRTFDLARLTARAERVARRHGGYAALIGARDRPSSPAPAPHRADSPARIPLTNEGRGLA